MCESSDQAVVEVRRKCLSRGLSGLKCFSTAFRQFDKDYTSELSYSEFEAGLQCYGIVLARDQQHKLFQQFDKDRYAQGRSLPCQPTECFK